MEDASNYKAFRLKKRLQSRFPQLVFHKPKRKRTSEIVYAEEISEGAVAERVVYYGELSDSDDDEEGEITKEPIVDERKIELKDLYSVALELKENIRSSSASWYEQWPPLASDITGENVRQIVSPRLFNFISWVLGYSDEPEECNYVDLDEELAVKVFSICQD